MPSRIIAVVLMLVAVAGAWGAERAQDASAALRPADVSQLPAGRRVVQDVVLATGTASYELRYDIIERKEAPGRVDFQMWAPTIGYTPLGIAGPSSANWYNQGFFIWTFDGFNIQDYQAEFRVIREAGPDAMVEYVWDTPKVRAVARFAMTARSDKLLFFGRYEPKEPIGEVKLRLMAYPATFDKPWQRALTTATRTLTEGTAQLDLAAERWLLLEDTLPGRTGAGSAGLLLGDAAAFRSATVIGIGGYGEYVDLVLDPSRTDFALGLYEFPSMPDYEITRAYFRRLADAESDALARLARADLDQPLEPLPVDETRLAAVVQADEESLARPAETWRAPEEPLDFPWAARLPGPPLRVALLAARWAAYDTMELARRLEMDVRHQYFDTKTDLTNARHWPYRGQTGIGPLSAGAATRHAVRICVDAGTDVIVIGDLAADALGAGLQSAILSQVKGGKGLVLTGGSGVLDGWPAELTAEPDERLAEPALSCLPWGELAGLRGGEAPLRGYRYGAGRVLVFTAPMGPYQSLLPLNTDVDGLDGAEDRLLAFHGLAFLAAAGRPLPGRIAFASTGVQAGAAGEIPVTISGTEWARALVRVQDDRGKVVALGRNLFDRRRSILRLPPLAGMRRYYVDVALENGKKECVGFGSAVIDVTPTYTFGPVALSPSTSFHEAGVRLADLPGGGTLACETRVSPAGGGADLAVEWRVEDCVGREVACAESAVAADGMARAELELPEAVVVAHRLHAVLRADGTAVAEETVRFTMPVPFPYDDFTILMWSYAHGELPVRLENRACYELGSDMMDLCHMRGYSDAGAAREYALAADSGQRLVPYVTRIAGQSKEDHSLVPGLFHEDWIEKERASMAICSRQAAPYQPAAYTLGDENYLGRLGAEVEVSPGSTAAFRDWLAERYGGIEALNAVWHTDYADFGAIERPMLIEDAAEQEAGFAPWFDFRDFMDTAFAALHERMAGFVRKEDPGARVGWDGFLGYHWLAGYDFYKLTRNLELNQTYTSHPIQCELVRSFKRDDALTGEWGNAIADNEAGFSAIAWHNLFKGHNSCWWWTSWGCDYIPFNPDLSLSHMGRWFFEQAQEVKSGPGRLLVHATREDSGIGVLYSQADLYADELASRMAGDHGRPSSLTWLNNLKGATHVLETLGFQYRFVAGAELEQGQQALAGFRVLLLPYAACLSESQVDAIRAFVEAGGTIIADGRTALLSGNGVIRAARPLDEVFGVTSRGGLEAFRQPPAAGTAKSGSVSIDTYVLEPALKASGGQAAGSVNDVAVFVSNRHGAGHALLLNVPFAACNALRDNAQEDWMLGPVGEALATAGCTPFARLRGEDGRRLRLVELARFVDGAIRYLCVEQDIWHRAQPAREATLTIDTPAFVYDVRGGGAIADTPIDSWDVTVSRGRPLLFALLPYRVAGVDADTPRRARAGDTVGFRVALDADGAEPGHHVVHVKVFAPGSDRPHREYSRNVDCPGGVGEGTIPFALNDAPGTWRLVFTDAATGVTERRKLRLKAAPRNR
ncbi:MAG: beta-galactosidase [Candidatus Hydrogenedentes bacterium]|nr:beta-galactosidase [Candidatus Hydrogenedentota bacterium]